MSKIFFSRQQRGDIGTETTNHGMERMASLLLVLSTLGDQCQPSELVHAASCEEEEALLAGNVQVLQYHTNIIKFS